MGMVVKFPPTTQQTIEDLLDDLTDALMNDKYRGLSAPQIMRALDILKNDIKEVTA